MPSESHDERVEITGVGGEQLELPAVLPVLPVRDAVVFPGVTRPLAVGRAQSLAALEAAGTGGLLVVATQLDPEIEEPDLDDLYPFACIVRLARAVDAQGAGKQAIVVGVARAQLKEVEAREPCLMARIEPLSESDAQSADRDALWKGVIERAHRIIDLRDDLPEEWKAFVAGLPSPGLLTDLVASTLPLSPEEQISLLGEANAEERLGRISAHLDREVTIAETQREISARTDAESDPRQRERLLRQRLRDLQAEIGEVDPGQQETDALRERIEAAELEGEAATHAEREFKRFAGLPTQAPERHALRTYLEWIADLPWNKESEDSLELVEARRILDEDHYDLDKVKERILENLAVRKLAPDARGAILCLVGPPGVGKTSLGRSVARAMGRTFTRTSLGGVRDEAEIRGHRRTYVGSMPGRILQSLRRAGTRNPVFLLDEIDKLGADFRGDPSSALLEVLDPEQNASFSDHYLEVPFDLSRVLFLATANTLSTIPGPLLDRMEVLELPGYTEIEKRAIARDHLVPKQVEAHGLRPEQIDLGPEMLETLVGEYTREAGVRNLDRQLASLMRRAARRIAEGSTGPVVIDAPFLKDALGAAPHQPDCAEQITQPGVVVGLAATSAGGEILFLEATSVPGGKGVRLRLTGQLGDVMSESAEAALSWVRSNAESLGVEVPEGEIHLHVPAGAVPKDGPSAGVALAAAIVSLLSGKPARSDVALTGEISLRGKVLPVGGIKSKLLAAARAGIKTAVLPRRNQKDLHDIPSEIIDFLDIIFVDETREALAVVL